MSTPHVRPELLTDAVWLAENHDRPGVRVLDARWRVDGSGRRQHAEGHVPGSVYVDWAADLVDTDDPLPYQLAKPASFAAAMVRLGVGDGMTVVVLDDTYSLYAARVWWSLQFYGVQSVRVLDGGWPAWLEAGGPVSTAATDVQPVAFSPDGAPGLRVEAEQVREALGSGGAQIIDARTPAEYLGQGGPGPRRGHISRALNVPAALLVQDGSQALPAADDLARIVTRAGVVAERQAITYDAVGVGAAKLSFCLTLLGHQDVALYDGGWPDWAARDETDYPIES